MRLGDKLHNYRVSKNLTVQEFAQQLNISMDIVDAWESYAKLPTVDELVKIEQVYGISVDQLLSEADASVTQQPVQQQPVYQQPVQQQPVYQQPVYQQPVQQQPVYQQPVQQQPVQQQPVYQQPVYQQPVYQQPVYRPVYAQPRPQVNPYVQPYVMKPKAPEMPTGLKALSWVSFGVAIAAFVIGFIVMISSYDYYHVYYQMGTAWIGLIAVLFQQPAFVTYIIGKAKGYDTSKRNLVIGIVFTSILLFFAMIYTYDPDYTYNPNEPSLSIALSAIFKL